MAEIEEKFSKERRRVPRVGGSIVEYTIDGKDAPVKKAFIKDICIYGICVYVSEKFTEKTVLNLDIYLFGLESPISVKGSVVWQKPGGFLGYYNVGVEFVKLSDECQNMLSTHITVNTQDKSEDEEE